MRLLVAAIAALALLAPAADAATWTEVPSGTASEITAIEYQGDDRFWFTTASGAIFKRQAGGAFIQVRSPSSVRLTDIEFVDGGPIGLAVGDEGQVLRSTDSGSSWNPVGSIPVSADGEGDTFVNCDVSEPLGDVYSVRFVGNGRAWLFAEGSQIARSAPGAPADVGATGTWVDANWNDAAPAGRGTEDSCKLTPGYGEGFADGFFVPATPDVGYIVASWGSTVFFTSNNLGSNASEKPASAGNAGSNSRTLVGDPDNPQRQWSVNRTPYGRSTTSYTEDGWQSENPFLIGNDSVREFPSNGAYDVDFRGGTVLSAGDAGMVLVSVDGRNHFYSDATGGLATQDWRAVSLASATQGAVGGTGGKLMISSTANAIPDTTKPTGTISGPGTGRTGEALNFTATLADEGGSGINAGASTWTTPGLPNATGPSASFTFPSAGTYTITLTFFDNAGNSNTATKSVTISGGSASLPRPSLPSTSNPPLTGGAAKKKGKFVVFRVKGRLGLPAGVTAAQGCNGTMSISVYKGKKRLAAKRTSVKSSCRYKKTVKVKRSKVGRAKKLKLKVAFKGNSFLALLSSTYKAKVK